MSNFPGLEARRVPNFRAAPGRLAAGVLAGVFAQDCALCGAPSGRLVCTGCLASLSRPRAACARCAIALAEAALCGRCRARPPAFDETRAAFDYRFPIDRLMQRFKYAGDLALGRWFAEELAATLRDADRPHVIACPPSTTERLRERGFNPALEIAKVVARRLDVRCAIGGLARARDTAPQPGLGRGARQRNIEGALRCAMACEGLHVALVDDVMTTGATANAAARVLKRAGAARVSVWAVARTPEPNARKGNGGDV